MGGRAMTGVLVAFGAALTVWIVQFLRDRGALERLLFRASNEPLAVLAGSIERSGEHVRDVSLLRDSSIRPNLFTGWFVLLGLYVLALVLAAVGVPPFPVALGLGLFLGAQALVENVMLVALGHADMQEEREGAERAWFLLAVALKVVAVTLCWWLALDGVRDLDGTWKWVAAAQVIAGIALLTQTHRPAAWALRRGRRHHKAEFAGDSSRELILFLRSFDDDDLTVRSALGVGGLSTPPLPTARLRLEEFVVQILRLFGRVVAIGRPGEGLPELGALRTYWSDDHWQDAVRLTATRCRAVVLVAGSSEGLAWELDRLRVWGLLSKTLVVLPPDRDAAGSARRFESAAHHLCPAGTVIASEFRPPLWTGLSIHEDGTLRHHIAEGRDWGSYAAMITAHFLELTGSMDAPPDGVHAALVDRVERISATTNSLEEALAVHAAEEALAPPGRQRRQYPSRRSERLNPVRAVALVTMMSTVIDKIEADKKPEAIAALADFVGSLKSDRTPVLASVLMTQQGQLHLDVGDADAAHAAFTAARSLALTGERRATLLGESWTPVEAHKDALEGLRMVAASRMDVPTALALDDEIRALYDEIGDREGVLGTHVDSANLLLDGEDEALAHQLAEVVRWARVLGDTERLRWAAWRLGNLAERRGEREVAQSHLALAAATADTRGEDPQAVAIRIERARVLLPLDRTAAVACLHEALAVLTRIADPEVGQPLGARLGDALGQTGEVDAAVDLFRSLAEREGGGADAVARHLVRAGHWHLEAGRWVEGLAVLDRAWATASDAAVRTSIREVVFRHAWRSKDADVPALRWRLHAEQWLASRGESRGERVRKAHEFLARALTRDDPEGAVAHYREALALLGDGVLEEIRVSEANVAHLGMVRALLAAGRGEEAHAWADRRAADLRDGWATTRDPAMALCLLAMLDLLAASSRADDKPGCYAEMLTVADALVPLHDVAREEQAGWQGWAAAQLARAAAPADAVAWLEHSVSAYRFCARDGNQRATEYLARSLHRLARALRRTRRPADAYAAAVEGLERLAGRGGATASSLRHDLSILAAQLTLTARPEVADAHLSEAEKALDDLASADASRVRLGHRAALWIARGDAVVEPFRAIPWYARAASACEGSSNPEAADYRAVALSRLATLLRAHQPADAGALLEDAECIARAALEREPEATNRLIDLATVLHNLACAQLAVDPDAAHGSWGEARAYVIRAANTRPGDAEASALLTLIDLHLNQLCAATAEVGAPPRS